MASKNKKLSSVAGIFEQSLEGAIHKLPLYQIEPSEEQPRERKDVNIEGLAGSLQEEGLLQPIVVTKHQDNKYAIIAGERRFRAAQYLGWNEIECRILRKDAREKYKLAVIENIQRENLGAIEEAQAFKKLKKDYDYTDEALAKVTGKARSSISEILSIAELPDEMKREAEKNGLRNKNLLIKFVQAVQNDFGKDFLQAYREGEITTVQSAKTFIQKHKNKHNAETEGKGDKNTSEGRKNTAPTPETNISVQWLNDTTLQIQGKATQFKIKDPEIPLERIEQDIKHALSRVLKSYSN